MIQLLSEVVRLGITSVIVSATILVPSVTFVWAVSPHAPGDRFILFFWTVLWRFILFVWIGQVAFTFGHAPLSYLVGGAALVLLVISFRFSRPSKGVIVRAQHIAADEDAAEQARIERLSALAQAGDPSFLTEVWR